MRIAMLSAPYTFNIVDRPVPYVGQDEVLVKVAYCGVCASELDVWSGRAGNDRFPFFPGHEVSGIVEYIGERVTNVREGDPVGVWVPNYGFAEYVVAKAEDCFRAERIALDQLLTEPIGCAVNAVEAANISLADDVIIVGAGFMGNLVQLLVELQGPYQIIVADTRADALERATSMGAAHVINVAFEPLHHRIEEATKNALANVTFEVTGAQAPLGYVGDITRMGGKVVLVGYHQGKGREIPLAQWNYKALQLVNAHFRDMTIIRRGMSIGMRLLNSRRLRLDRLITHRFALDDIGTAFRTAYEKPDGFVKSTVCIEA